VVSFIPGVVVVVDGVGGGGGDSDTFSDCFLRAAVFRFCRSSRIFWF